MTSPGGFGSWSGTSFAAPIVAGRLAQDLLDRWTRSTGKRAVTPKPSRRRVRHGAREGATYPGRHDRTRTVVDRGERGRRDPGTPRDRSPVPKGVRGDPVRWHEQAVTHNATRSAGGGRLGGDAGARPARACDPDAEPAAADAPTTSERLTTVARVLATLAKSEVEVRSIDAGLVRMAQASRWAEAVGADDLLGFVHSQHALLLFRGGRFAAALGRVRGRCRAPRPRRGRGPLPTAHQPGRAARGDGQPRPRPGRPHRGGRGRPRARRGAGSSGSRCTTSAAWSSSPATCRSRSGSSTRASSWTRTPRSGSPCSTALGCSWPPACTPRRTRPWPAPRGS